MTHANADAKLGAALAATAGAVFTGHIDATAWEPFTFMQDGAQHSYGEMVLFRATGSAGNGLAVGLWRAPDGPTPIYTSEAGDETFLVLSGEVAVEFLDRGETLTFRPGDVCSWSRHSRTRWQLRNGFRKFFVVARDSG
ncbi:MAG: cupin domain-containing protein [Gammaproteobacteria bacterium]